jgi:DNA processing protein
MNHQTIYWVAFNLVKGIGPVRLEKLLGYFGDVQTAWQAPEYQLQSAGLSLKLSQQLQMVRSQVSLSKLEEQIQ